ncbi:MAG: hypothetical protein GSR73_06735 [Desulfurococcales archaeon]|nr:hypothetical protein [Desulfurococcales archaeon]
MTVVSLKLKRLVDKAIELYNRYRAPESVARLERIEGDVVVVRFDGSFCLTCGINDWVEDFKYVLEDLGAEVELLEIVEPDDPFSEELWRIGFFRVKRVPDRIREPQQEIPV